MNTLRFFFLVPNVVCRSRLADMMAAVDEQTLFYPQKKFFFFFVGGAPMESVFGITPRSLFSCLGRPAETLAIQSNSFGRKRLT